MSYLLKVATIDLILSLHRRAGPSVGSPRAGHQSRDRRTLPQAGQSRAKTSHCALRLRQPESASKPANAPSGSDSSRRRQNQPLRPPARIAEIGKPMPASVRPVTVG